jgi:hypothetical protein
MGLYHKDDGDVAHAVCDWAIAHGHDPHLRIALCGYDGDYNMPPDWTAIRWRAVGGYGNQGTGAGRANAAREVVWCSPHCLQAERPWILALSDQIETIPEHIDATL